MASFPGGLEIDAQGCRVGQAVSVSVTKSE